MPRKTHASTHQVPESGRGHRAEASRVRTPYGAAQRVVEFLNTCPATLGQPEQRLQAAMRELCDLVLQAAAETDEDKRFGLSGPMNVLWQWYNSHPYILDLGGWRHAASSPLRPVYRCAAGRDPRDANLLGAPRTELLLVRGEQLAAHAALSLWLLLLLADPISYRDGRGFIFHSTRGRRMRLLRCTKCRDFFIRSAGRTSGEQNTCSRCPPPRTRGPRGEQYRRRKIAARVARLERAWKARPWDPRKRPVIFWEPGPADRGLLQEVYVDGADLVIRIIGGEEAEQRRLAASAMKTFHRQLTESSGTESAPE
jgi:hypothetical protein